MTREEKRKRNLEIVECYKQGHSTKEISELFGIKTDLARSILRKAGFVLNNYTQYSEDWIRENLDEGFEYISGFKNAHSHITIKGVECGHIFTKSMSTITRSDRKNPIICPECKRLAGEKRKPKETREQKKKRNEKIVELRKQGYTIKQLAEKFNVSETAISSVCKQYGLGKEFLSKEERQERDNKIIELKKQGYAIKDIVEIVGFGRWTVSKVLNEVGLGEGKKERHSEEWVQGFLDEGFEYVGGFKNVDSYITIKCKECGYVFDRSMISIRHKERRTTCPECQKARIKEREEEQKRQAEERKKEREEQKRLKQIEIEKKRQQQIQMKKCKCCGNIFYTEKNNRMYCSDKCSRRAREKKKDHARRIRIEGQMVDSDITIERLFDRDNGKCALCGGVCDWNDYTRKNNYFVVGNFYPSIDHIIPISKGGKHSWDNVQLAHFICNSKKSNTMPRYA